MSGVQMELLMFRAGRSCAGKFQPPVSVSVRAQSCLDEAKRVANLVDNDVALILFSPPHELTADISWHGMRGDQ